MCVLKLTLCIVSKITLNKSSSKSRFFSANCAHCFAAAADAVRFESWRVNWMRHWKASITGSVGLKLNGDRDSTESCIPGVQEDDIALLGKDMVPPGDWGGGRVATDRLISTTNKRTDGRTDEHDSRGANAAQRCRNMMRLMTGWVYFME